jgi:hypothetical protein
MVSMPGMPLSTASTAAASTCTLGDGNVSLTVLEPTANQVVTTPTLPLRVVATGFRLDGRYAGTPDLQYVGHYHEILDGNLVDMTPMQDPNNDTISMVAVEPGPHTLTIMPACNDHTMVMSAAVNIPFTYSGPYLPPPAPQPFAAAPSISILSPANGATVSGDTFTITAAVSNFALCGDCFGKLGIAGVGHWHIFVDAPTMTNMKTMAGDTSQAVSLKGISPGWHTFYALLVNNYHMPLMSDPTGLASVTLYVESAN